MAKGRFQNFVNKTGYVFISNVVSSKSILKTQSFRWAFVEVESKTTWPDDMQAFAAGMAEGYLTKDMIYDFWRNTIEVCMDGWLINCQFHLGDFCFDSDSTLATMSPKYVNM